MDCKILKGVALVSLAFGLASSAIAAESAKIPSEYGWSNVFMGGGRLCKCRYRITCR